ncbi:MAG: class II aldolase/adducin family protein [Spirochaetaceae bacterium]|nr:MAG: class II aldolase/adducin family protein [Spirochaetaceae bacterium]
MKDVKRAFREKIVQTGLHMIETGLTVGTWGNISIRDPETDYMYISPSGMEYISIEPEHVVVLDLDTNHVDGEYEPSVEKHMHAAVYRKRRDVNAVVHTHPIYSSAFGVVEMELPAISEDFAQVVGDCVTVALPYELPGTPELGRVAAAALERRNAVLLPRHGALSVGPTMEWALKVCRVLEKNAQIFLLARTLGTPVLFQPEEIETMQSFLKEHYGKRNSNLLTGSQLGERDVNRTRP